MKIIANILRPYRIRVYLDIDFASPMALGYTKTADPLDKKVQQWWQKKAKEIYATIPDFGGFLVKANSEGQPGPGDYHRTHADGANMLADAVKPYRRHHHVGEALSMVPTMRLSPCEASCQQIQRYGWQVPRQRHLAVKEWSAQLPAT